MRSDDTDANADVIEKQRALALAASAVTINSSSVIDRDYSGRWMDFALCTGPPAAIDRCKQHCTDADVAAWRSSEFSHHSKLPLFVKTHKVAGSVFGRYLKKAQQLMHDEKQCRMKPTRTGDRTEHGRRRACREAKHRMKMCVPPPPPSPKNYAN